MKRKTIISGCALFFLFGILIAAFVNIQMLFALGIFLFFGIFFWQKYAKKTAFFLPFLWTAFFALGAWHTATTPLFPAADDIGIYATTDGTKVEVEGNISAFPDKRYRKEYWVLSAERIFDGGKWRKTHGKILFTVRRGSELSYGEKVKLTGFLKSPFISEEFSYRGYLARQGIFSVMPFPRVTAMQETAFHPLLSPLYSLRVWFIEMLQRFIPPPENGFALGILIGDRSELSPDTLDTFQKTGLSHMLALSGYNITIIAIAVFFLTFWLPKRIRIIVTIGFLAAFVLFVGGGESVIRAAIMGGIGLVAVHSGRKQDAFYLLLLASGIMTAFHPLIAAYGASFQLSFCGVLGIVAFSAPLNNFFEKRGVRSRFWREILVATLAAQIGVLPLIGFLFGQISLISPLANLIIAPLIPFSMLISFLTVMVGSIWEFGGEVLGFFTWNILHAELRIIDFLASIPFASVSMHIGKIGFLTLVAIILGIWRFISRKGKRQGTLP